MVPQKYEVRVPVPFHVIQSVPILKFKLMNKAQGLSKNSLPK